ncbi:hypothetical protein ACFQ0M_11340 [Kitasatospora aburaviensis]
MTTAPLIGAGVIVPTGDGRVLIGRRTTAGEPPTWSLPGGKVDTPGSPSSRPPHGSWPRRPASCCRPGRCGSWASCSTTSSAGPG